MNIWWKIRYMSNSKTNFYLNEYSMKDISKENAYLKIVNDEHLDHKLWQKRCQKLMKLKLLRKKMLYIIVAYLDK